MTTIQSPSKATTQPQARKLIAHMPSPEISGDKENLTVDSAALSSLTALSKPIGKKSRSKSIGPGGLDALKENAGNRRAVRYSIYTACKAEYTKECLGTVCFTASD